MHCDSATVVFAFSQRFGTLDSSSWSTIMMGMCPHRIIVHSCREVLVLFSLPALQPREAFCILERPEEDVACWNEPGYHTGQEQLLKPRKAHTSILLSRARFSVDSLNPTGWPGQPLHQKLADARRCKNRAGQWPRFAFSKAPPLLPSVYSVCRLKRQRVAAVICPDLRPKPGMSAMASEGQKEGELASQISFASPATELNGSKF